MLQEVETDEELKALKKAGQWRLEGSSFWPRAVSSDSQSLWDLHVAYHKAFQADWEYLKKFVRVLTPLLSPSPCASRKYTLWSLVLYSTVHHWLCCGVRLHVYVLVATDQTLGGLNFKEGFPCLLLMFMDETIAMRACLFPPVQSAKYSFQSEESSAAP